MPVYVTVNDPDAPNGGIYDYPIYDGIADYAFTALVPGFYRATDDNGDMGTVVVFDRTFVLRFPTLGINPDHECGSFYYPDVCGGLVCNDDTPHCHPEWAF